MTNVDVERVVAGRYRLASELHRGSGVETHLAEDLGAGDDAAPVVIKVAALTALSEAAVRRLDHEGVVLAQLDHPNVARLLDHGRDGDVRYLVTPWVPGRSLDARLADGALPVDEALTVIRDVVAALCHAHDHGVLHRDVKPANIVVDGSPTERAVLIDFGLARSGLLDADIRDIPVGSARYLAPEQAGLIPGPTDERSDLYAVGLTLVECLTGAPMFDGASVGQVLRQKMTGSVPRLDDSVPRVLRHVADRLVQRDPAERYQRAEALLYDLDRLVEGRRSGRSEPVFVVGSRDRRETLAEPSFVGRRAEIAALEAAVSRAEEGDGGIVVVGAESGAGKSRLLEELGHRVGEPGPPVRRPGPRPGGPAPLPGVLGCGPGHRLRSTIGR